MLEKGWNPRLPCDTPKKDLVDIHQTERSFKMMLDKARHNSNKCRQDSFKYTKERWNKSHKPPDFKIERFLCRTIYDKTLHGPNDVQLELTGEVMNKHPAFPVSLIKHSSSSDKGLFPLRNKPPLEIPTLEEGEEKKIVEVLKERRKINKREREYLVRYRTPTQEDEWILEKYITNSDRLKKRIRHERRPK
ncbi:hypothetical protein O181_060485 [Austropuccinia psidii MF-1]|uniref:Chromo domain-containing protein n=1 Tax=Austropuccinia psidii MF-1 TaxID=1389203 RepID=A0A9Q3EDF2_9BASI|nr:hypothetical protein [Austropuccinia psidii MF-1]